MKIFVINPNTSDGMTAGIDASAKAYARPDTQITTVHPREGARSFESMYEEDLSGQEVFRLVKEANAQKYDAIVIACFGDPHLRGSREISDIPVYGIAESSMYTACLLGNKFSIVAPREWMRPGLEEHVRRLGLESRLASIRIMDIPVLKVEQEHGSASTIDVIAKASKAAISEDGAEVILMGCSVLANLDKIMEEKVGVPCLDGVVCAVKLAEAFYDYKLTHSKVKTFRRPDPQQWLGMENFRI